MVPECRCGAGFPGIETKVLMEDRKTGLLTALFRCRPGAELPLHEHVEIEQTYVLEGSILDDEGEVTAGNFVWRPAGNRHRRSWPVFTSMIACSEPPRFLQTLDRERLHFHRHRG